MRKVIPVRRNAPMAAACRRNPGRESLQVPRRLCGDTERSTAGQPGGPRGPSSQLPPPGRSLTLSPEGALITESWRTWHEASVVASSLELTERVYRPAKQLSRRNVLTSADHVVCPNTAAVQQLRAIVGRALQT
ncbi:hypothetical protein MTO96_003129 [Rhipicephalus appendiculatus]